MRRAVALSFAIISAPALAAAQVQIAPAALILSDRAPSGTLLVANRSLEAQEISIDFRFGYPRTDSLGQLGMAYGDTLPAADRSLGGWIRAFPRRFTLPAGDEQVVRILARPPANLDEGVYWTRVVTAAMPRPTASTSESQGVAAEVHLRLEQVTTALYRHGRVFTGVDIGAPAVHSDAAGVLLLVPLVRGGNAPFFGTIRTIVRDADGEAVASAEEVFAMYVDVTKRFAFDRTKLGPGSYSAEIRVTPERGDIPRDQLLQVSPAIRTFEFTVQ